MTFSASEFFAYRLDHLQLGADGFRLMERWLELETCWRQSLLELIRVEAYARLSSDVRDRHLALQALAFVGDRDDLERLIALEVDHDAGTLDTRELAVAELRRELTTDEELAQEVHDGESFRRFVREIVRRRGRADRLLESGFASSELRDRERWGVHTISLFLDNATCEDEALRDRDGPSWRELADAILLGRDFQ